MQPDISHIRSLLYKLSIGDYDLLGGERQAILADILAAPAAVLLPVLMRLMDDADDGVQCEAINALLKWGGSAYLDMILPRMECDSEVVREYVCGVLGDLGDKRAVAPMAKALLNDPSADVRWLAANSLGMIGNLEALSALEHARAYDPYVNWEGRSVREVAAQAIDSIQAKLREQNNSFHLNWL